VLKTIAASTIMISTLSSYYLYNIGIGLNHMAIIALLLFALVSRSINYSKRLTATITLVFTSIFFSLISSLMNANEGSLNIATPLSIIIYVFGAANMISYIFKYIKISHINNAIAVIIILHAFFLTMQFVSWHALSIRIDYIQWFNGENSRNIGGYYKGSILYRPSGLFNEPGTYAAYAISLLIMYIVMKGRNLAIYVISIMSIIFCLSFQGILSVITILSIMYYNRKKYGDGENNKSRKIFKGAGIIFTAVLAIIIGFDVMSERFFDANTIDTSLAQRLFVLDEMQKIPIFGFGLTSVPTLGTGNTLFLYLYSYMGILSVIPILAAVISLRRHMRLLLFTLLFFTTKIVPTEPFFWIFLFLMIMMREHTVASAGRILRRY
jgi:hypothetical protein